MKIDDFLRDRCEYTDPMLETTEDHTQEIVVDFLRSNFHNVLFLPSLFEIVSKYANHRISAIQKAYKLGHEKGNPDLWIMHPQKKYIGVLAELKRPGEKIMTGKNELKKNEHIKKQAQRIAQARDQGIYADFFVGSNAFKGFWYWYIGECDISPIVRLPHWYEAENLSIYR